MRTLTTPRVTRLLLAALVFATTVASSDLISARPALLQDQEAAEIGNGVTAPRLLRDVKPVYTREAIEAKIEGDVWLKVVVLPDGTVGRVEVVKSLDAVHGLDDQAVAAARQWLFNPGTKDGKPVAVRVMLELTFTLRK